MNSENQSFELSLLVLNLDKNKFNKMKINELKHHLIQNLKNTNSENKQKIFMASKIALQNKNKESELELEYNQNKLPSQPGAKISNKISCNYNNQDIDEYSCPLQEYNPFNSCNKCNCKNDTKFPCNLINNSRPEESVKGYNIGFEDNYNYDNLLRFNTPTYREALITPSDSDLIYEPDGYPKLNTNTFNPNISRLSQPLQTLGLYQNKVISNNNYKENFTTFTSEYNSTYFNNNGNGFIKVNSSNQLNNEPKISKSFEKKISNNKIIN